MEESWRFQPVRGGVCCTCGVSHFPFCPPPAPFYGNGFPPDDPRHYTVDDSPFHRPFHAPSPFAEHHRTPPPTLPHHQNPMAPRNLESWNGYSLPERETFGPPFHTPERLFSEGAFEREMFRKRMRLGDEVPGFSASPQLPDRFGSLPRNISLEDERRLNLIRDHGRAQLNLPFEGEQRPNGGYSPIDRRPRVGPQNPCAWTGTDRDLHVPRSGLTGNNGLATADLLFFNHKMHALRDGSYGDYQDIGGAPNFQDADRFIHSEAKELERRDWVASNILRSNSAYVDISHRQYGHSDILSDTVSYRYSDVVADKSKSYVGHYSPELSSKRTRYLEESAGNSQKQVPHSPSYAVSQGSRKMLNHQQHLQQEGAFEAQYPRNGSYQAPFTPNVGHYSHIDHNVHEHVENKYETCVHENEVSPSLKLTAPLYDSFRPLDRQNYDKISQPIVQTNQGGHLPAQSSSDVITSVGGQLQTPQALLYPAPQPLPGPPPMPSLPHFQVSSSLSMVPPPVSPLQAGLSVDVSRSYAVQGLSEAPTALETYLSNERSESASTIIATERQPLFPQTLSKQHPEEGQGQALPLKHVVTEKRTVIDASHIFHQPHRATRPDHIAVILRGLPGSGKSYLAKAIRDLEVDNGGNAPRIHCMDDYFMTEVEKVEEIDGSKSSGPVKGKKQMTRKVMEYFYEPEMEEAYRSSMLKAFKKTVEDGIFNFVIVDDRNLRVADFAQFWAIGKRSGYEVYLLEATYKDPTGCAARNVHGFTLDDIKRMAEKWEEAPAFYFQLDIQSLFRGDDLNESNIQEVDMDTEDIPHDERVTLEAHDKKSPKGGEQTLTDDVHGESANIGERWITEREDFVEARELGKSKWSKDLDEDIDEMNGAMKHSSALSGLIQAYGKSVKSVHWGDQVKRRGFSIGASKNQSVSSLMIGPGSGYNVKSNPLPEEESFIDVVERNSVSVSRKRSAFLEHIRAERESFRAVFDRRRQRIGGLNVVVDD